MALASLLASLFVAVTPGVANAGNIVPCPADITEWRGIGPLRPGYRWEGYRYTLLSAAPYFLVSEGQLLDNGTDSTVPYTITTTRSTTFRITSAVGVQAGKAEDFLKTNVSTTIEASRTTSLGVSFTVQVPPRTRLIAEYGVEAYQVNYAIEAWRATAGPNNPPPTGARCEEWGYYPQSGTAPTYTEGWRLRTA
ncbi:hypothetical protein [Nonomuraea aurantiaca]|uniref:hypothetical protein n=1 Tax=Nonomuraea aurantiaca TaxID=2878562 RepID=UPI001CD9BDEE|nr:hypothetical protein [Nonomuraea aurantiaca]MCA2230480.1 hypothetical protein [Nonomuraea aurantiaca]